MNFESNNPFESPRQTNETKRVGRRGNLVLTASVAVACFVYAAFTVFLMFADAIAGGMFLCNWPVLGIWVWSVWAHSTRAFLFGLIAIGVQMGITLSMFVFFQNVNVDAVLWLNGSIVAVFVVLTLLIRWAHRSLYHQEPNVEMGL